MWTPAYAPSWSLPSLMGWSRQNRTSHKARPGLQATSQTHVNQRGSGRNVHGPLPHQSCHQWLGSHSHRSHCIWRGPQSHKTQSLSSSTARTLQEGVCKSSGPPSRRHGVNMSHICRARPHPKRMSVGMISGASCSSLPM